MRGLGSGRHLVRHRGGGESRSWCEYRTEVGGLRGLHGVDDEQDHTERDQACPARRKYTARPSCAITTPGRTTIVRPTAR